MYALLLIYKLTCLIIGFSFALLGYKLLLKAKFDQQNGDLEIQSGALSIKLSTISTGVFFSLFGAGIVLFTIYKGMFFSENSHIENTTRNTIPHTLPSRPAELFQ